MCWFLLPGSSKLPGPEEDEELSSDWQVEVSSKPKGLLGLGTSKHSP